MRNPDIIHLDKVIVDGTTKVHHYAFYQNAFLGYTDTICGKRDRTWESTKISRYSADDRHTCKVCKRILSRIGVPKTTFEVD